MGSVSEDLDLLDGLDIAIPEPNTQAASDAAAAADGGQFFGPYQLIQEVGAGGVAKVMRARHIHPSFADKTFAVKVLHESLSQDPKVVALFRREAYVLSLLKHANVVQTFEAGAQEDKLFIAMEYVDGRDLDNMMVRCAKAQVPMTVSLMMHMVGEVLKGLTFAHELVDADNNSLNLIHRDVNPANVFVSYDGRIKLGDFGVASITAGRVEKSREIAGKVGYFSPEQLSGDPVDHRADLFSVGVMMFEMLTGTRLFDGDDADAVLRLNRRAKIPKPSKLNPNISAGLERALLKALERKPQDRYGSGREMLEALHDYIPAPAGMRLAVASMMRRVFLGEHIAELQLREGLAGRSPSRGTGQLVDLLTNDERAMAAFSELLTSRGYRVQAHRDLDALCDALLRQPPQVLMVDIAGPEFVSTDFNTVMASSPLKVPVVAISQALDEETIRRAHQVHAVDLLFKPYNIERVLTALRGASTGHLPSVADDMPERPAQNIRTMLVTNDLGLANRIAGLDKLGYDLEVVPSAELAFQRAEQISVQAVIYDAHPFNAADRLFAGQFRAAAGIGMVPIVFLMDEVTRPMFRGMLIDRTQVLPRGAGLPELVQALDTLREDTRAGRTFVRYEAEVPSEIRYGGRVFACTCIDVSRGGVMLQSEHIPPVGTEVGATLRVPLPVPPVSLVGRVVRVNLVKVNGRDVAQVGVEFSNFAPRSEQDLIAFITALDRGHLHTRTLILDNQLGGHSRAR